MHEDFSRGAAGAQGSSDHSFGLVLTALFALIAVLPLLHGPISSVRWWAAGLSVACLTLTRLRGERLNRLWQKIGRFLSKVTGPIVLALIFYAVVTPTGLMMRALGKDPLRLRRNGAAASYWIKRAPPGPTPATMKDQF